MKKKIATLAGWSGVFCWLVFQGPGCTVLALMSPAERTRTVGSVRKVPASMFDRITVVLVDGRRLEGIFAGEFELAEPVVEARYRAARSELAEPARLPDWGEALVCSSAGAETSGAFRGFDGAAVRLTCDDGMVRAVRLGPATRLLAGTGRPFDQALVARAAGSARFGSRSALRLEVGGETREIPLGDVRTLTVPGSGSRGGKLLVGLLIDAAIVGGVLLLAHSTTEHMLDGMDWGEARRR